MTPYPTVYLSTRPGRVVATLCSYEMYDNLQVIFAQTLNDLRLSNKILMTSNFFKKAIVSFVSKSFGRPNKYNAQVLQLGSL